MKTGIEIITEERQRQIEKEGWTPEHDDEYVNDELSSAAACYATRMDKREYKNPFDFVPTPKAWPWEELCWKPTPEDRIKELAKAGALIAAEIDRLQRERGEVWR
jgi:hypothetical protein